MIEQPPYQADVKAKQAAVDQLQAQLENAKLTMQRAKTLLTTPAGQQSTYTAALASEKALAAQVLGAQAQLDQSKINFAYTEIHAPIDGKIGRTSITEGNVVGPTSGVLATIVSQDPMYVTFPVPVRTMLSLRERYGTRAASTRPSSRSGFPTAASTRAAISNSSTTRFRRRPTRSSRAASSPIPLCHTRKSSTGRFASCSMANS